NELQETKRKLEAREQQLQAVKRTYVMDLPESKQFHLEALNSLRNQLVSSQDRLRRAEADKMMLQSIKNTSAPTVDLDERSSSAGTTSSLQKQLQKLEARLSDLQVRYGPNFPDVRKAQADLDRLRKRAAAEEAHAATAAPTEVVASPPTRKNPVLDGQVQKLNQEAEEQIKLQTGLQQQIDFHISKLERVPVFEQQIAGLMRDYDSLRSHYQDLLDKKLSAQMASELEVRQKGERFLILDPAPVPDHPYGPNRPLILLAGLLV